MRAAVFATVAALGLAACGSSGNASLSAKCTDRLVARAETLGHVSSSKAEVRRYARVTYCDRFAQKGWVYADGALSIDAQHWLEQGARCAASSPGGKTVTIPCVDPSENPRTIDCGMLHFVRRSEVRTYIDELQRSVKVICDDHTPLTALGVP